MSPKPKLIVFDLDYTLWPFWVDTHVTPPFHKGNGKILDKHNHKIKCYPEVPDVLKKLHEEGYQIGVASRTGEIKGAQQLISLFNWKDYFVYEEIYPGSKIGAQNKLFVLKREGNTKSAYIRVRWLLWVIRGGLLSLGIKSKSGLSYEDMIFFDDEHRNIDDLTREGVLSIFVKDGVSWKVINEGLEEYARKYKK